MIKNLIFIVIYILLYNIFSAEILLGTLAIQCIYNIYDDIKNKSYGAILLLYVATILISISNILLLSKFDIHHTVYTFIVPEYIPDATLLLCIGSSTLFLGYEVFKKKSFPKIDINISAKKLNTIFYIIFSYNLLSILNGKIAFTFLGSGVVNFIGLFVVFTIIVYARIWTKEKNRKAGIYAVTLCVLETYIELTTAYRREAIILPLLALTIGYAIGLGSPRKIFSAKMLPFAILFIFFIKMFSAFGSHRTNFLEAVYDTDNTENASETPNETPETNKDKGSFFDRSANLAQLTNCIKLTKVNGFYHGSVSSILVTALVPRVFWPDKPQIKIGVWFAVEIGSAYVDENGKANNSINMTHEGELYLDFGWIGVIIGCFLLGALVSLFWNAANMGASAYNITGSMWAGYLFHECFTDLGADLQNVITMFSTYFIFFVIKKLFGK